MENDPFKTQRDDGSALVEELRAAGFDDASEVGCGGFGIVFRATQVGLDRTVAVKVLTADLDLNRERFLREQRAMGRLTGHPNIVGVLQIGETLSGSPYLVMPFHQRGSLQTRIRQLGPLSIDEVIALVVKLAGALGTAHRLGILHRDIKPANILLTDYGEPALSDFGIAHIAGAFTTAAGTFTGSPAFTAPEILSGEPSSRASDVYALGATAFAALTGHAAFERRSGEQLITQFLRIANEAAPDLRKTGIPDDVAVLIERAMARDPAARPSATELGDALRHIQSERGVPVDDMALRSDAQRLPADSHGRRRRTVGNLPEQLTPFVGRRRELGEVRNMLTSTRVLTLIGTGGVGKTRLALAVAADRQRAFPDGVWYVALDGIEEGKLLITHVSDVLGHWFDVRDGDLAGSLGRSLRDKHLLLILDNCEHLIEEAATLAEVVARMCPKVSILATSRTPLRAAGDVTYQVPPLGIPTELVGSSEGDLDASDAVRLFVERARAAISDFTLTSENRSGVYELVRRLDGLPLAIELAAVRLRSLTVQQIAERVASHRTMLNWGGRSIPVRQQTMRSSLQWSAELCTEEERRLWARLAIFRGTFDLDAVEAVCCEDMPSDEVLDLLQGLVERSIIAREDYGSVVRYSMLGVIRHFGGELLDELGEDVPALRERHMSWYLRLIATADADWDTERQGHWLRILPLEHKNIVAAISVASANEENIDAAADAVFKLWHYYWWPRFWLAEGMYWIEHCCRRLANPVLRARLLFIGSLCAGTAGDFESQTALLQEGQSAAENSGDSLSLGLAEHVKGDTAICAGNPRAGIAHFRSAVAMYEPSAVSWRVDSLLGVTLGAAVLGDVDVAEAAHLETMALLAPAERFQRSYSLVYFGEALRRHGSIDKAVAAVREALILKAELGDPFGTAWTVDILAELAHDMHKPQRAALLLGAAHRMWKSMAIDEPTLERLQIREGSIRERLRSRIGPSGFAEQFRRGEQLTSDAAVAAALDDGEAPVTPLPARGGLTPRESEIAELVAQGLTNRQIASKLVIAQRTADAHVQNILTKLGFNTRSQIAAWIVS
jgi:non-specific serine/threonine protein kinase